MDNTYLKLVQDVLKQIRTSDKVVISGYSLPSFDFTRLVALIHSSRIPNSSGVYEFQRGLEFRDITINGDFIMQHVQIKGDLILSNVHIRGSLIFEDVTVYGSVIVDKTYVGGSISASSLKVKKAFRGDTPKVLKFSHVSFNSDNNDKLAGSIHLFPGLEVDGDVVFESIEGLDSIGMADAKIVGSLRISDTDIPGILDLKFTQITKDREDPWKIGEPYFPVARPIIFISNSKIGAINLWTERDNESHVIEGYYESLVPTIKFENVSITYFLISNRDIIGSVKFENCVFEDTLNFISVKIVGDLIFDNCEIKLGGKPNCGKVYLEEIDHNFDIDCTKRMIFRNTRFENPRIKREFLHLARYTLEKNGYDKDADAHFLKEKRTERYIKRINRECKGSSFAENIVSMFMDKTVFRFRNDLIQAIAFALLAVLPVPIPILFLFAFFIVLAIIIPSFFAFLEYLIADFSCAYGTDWKRPIGIWIGVVGIAFPVIYKFCLNLGWVEAIYSSALIAVTLGFGKLPSDTLNSVTSSLVIIEAIFGTFMWAVFLTVFARKFMRK